jgi:AcrR family transcriptional regulator
MPRDPAATRERLIDAGRELFAQRGALTTPLKQVVDAAGQRNTSALHYHFGGREGLLASIIESHNVGIEAERRELLDVLDKDAGLRTVVEVFVMPQVRLLDDRRGRQFLSIVSQLVDLFDRWDASDDAVPTEALRALRLIEARLPADLDPSLRRERITRFLGLVSEALGARARQLDRRRPPALTTEEFVSNLVDMAVGALSAETAPVPDRRWPPAHAGSR